MKDYIDTITLKTNLAPKKILEIGTRDGHDANYLKEAFRIKSEDVFVVEPHPDSYKQICIDYPEFNIYNVAFSNENGQHKFHALKRDAGISSLLERNDDFYKNTPHEVVMVDVSRGDTFLQNNNLSETQFDLCKIDVEGLTYEVLEGFGDLIRNIKSMHIENEYNQIWKGQKVYSEVIDLLESLGYVQIYEKQVNNVRVQSDSIWTLPEHIKNK